MNSSPPGPDLPESSGVSPQGSDPTPRLGSFPTSDLFFGAEGLRAGWGILLFLALFEAFRSGAYPLLQLLSPPTSRIAATPPRTMYVYEGGGLLCVLAATWLTALLERRPVRVYGFSRRRRFRNFAEGLAWGIMLLTALIMILRLTGLLVFDARLLSGGSIVLRGTLWLGGFLLVGLLEESFSRGYLQFTLTRGLSAIYRWLFGEAHANALGFWTAALILSFAFGFGHRANPGESPLGLLSAGLAGFLFCFSLWRTGSLWWAIGFHTAWDWAQSFLYGVADSGLMVSGHLYATHPVGRPYLSGGLTGPEGSLFLLPVMLAGVAAIVFTLPRTNFGYKPANTPSASLH